MEKLIITVATTGAVTTRDNSPYLPITPEEIANEVFDSYNAGASIAHIHVRDEKGNPSMDFEKFQETVERIKDKCDIIINLTSSGGLNLEEEERLKVCELAPEFASLDAGSMNFGPSVFINSPPFLEKLSNNMNEYNVKPEIEVFDTGMINNALMLAKKGLIKPPFHFQFVLGVPGGMTATPKNLIHLVDSIPSGSTWSVIGIGKHQLAMNTLGIVLGGHVRVGMEDNVFYKKDELAKTNAQFVERIVRISGELGREVADVNETRKILGLNHVGVVK
ncbi:3-keto-5-aminohexanoate cleavage protein [Virgibacillus salinus]|uniref:3-keto-5-aminohexanoate cleavage enzyme n=1 Tax=Virgibacillus salinus TaxID=553311 RepID=A0A1H0YNL8_9BACI|nr:3-keto-5-aminohexanoate cleavage protein [Virgibacillus salinus]SDQ16740.1 3-keto-5-aminohexanoate cleavage enzyme [Virgibacillus salinus]